MRKRIFDLAGESFENADGSSRQAILKQCAPGDPVKLLREPNNPHGSTAILVTNSLNEGLGYIASSDSKELAPILDKGRTIAAQIHELRGGLPDYPSIGCRVSIALDGKPIRPPIAIKVEQSFIDGAPARAGCLGVIIALAVSWPVLQILLHS